MGRLDQLKKLLAKRRVVASRYVYTQTKAKMKLVAFSKPRTLHLDAASIRLSSNNRDLYVLDLKEAKATIIPTDFNPKRRNLVRSSGRDGFWMSWYTDNQNKVFIGVGRRFIIVPEDELSLLYLGIRRYRKRKFIKPDNRPSGVDYGEPREQLPPT